MSNGRIAQQKTASKKAAIERLNITRSRLEAQLSEAESSTTFCESALNALREKQTEKEEAKKMKWKEREEATEDMLAEELAAVACIREKLEKDPVMLEFREMTGHIPKVIWWETAKYTATQIEPEEVENMETQLQAFIEEKVNLLKQYEEYFSEQAEMVRAYVQELEKTETRQQDTRA